MKTLTVCEFAIVQVQTWKYIFTSYKSTKFERAIQNLSCHLISKASKLSFVTIIFVCFENWITRAFIYVLLPINRTIDLVDRYDMSNKQYMFLWRAPLRFLLIHLQGISERKERKEGSRTGASCEAMEECTNQPVPYTDL